MKYSVIIPCYNSEHTIRQVVELTSQALQELHIVEYEIILIDDYSTDKTLTVIRELVKTYTFVKGIRLGKNFGQTSAIMAGLNAAEGQYIINMDDDLQTHPSQLYKIIEESKKGHEIVIASYEHKKHNLFRNFLTYMGDQFDKLCLGRPKHLKFTSFWIITKHIRDEMIKYNGPFPYMEGLFLQVSSDITNIKVEHFERVKGHSGYNFRKLVKLFLNSTNFTIIPLRVATLIGLFSSCIGLVSAVVLVIRRLLDSNIVMGWTSLMVMILIFSGIILLCIGLLGEYIGRIFMCINHAPQFVVRENITHALSKEEQDKTI